MKTSSGGGKAKEEEQDGASVHSPCKAPPSTASSLPKVYLSQSFSFYIYLICDHAHADEL